MGASHGGRMRLTTATATLSALVVVVTLWLSLVPQATGFGALLNIAVPHMQLTALFLVGAAWINHHHAASALAAASLLVVGGIASEWVSVPARSGFAPDLAVLSWNLDVGAAGTADIIDALTDSDADIVALQELTYEAAAAIEADPILARRYPYRTLTPAPRFYGMGVLSKHPITFTAAYVDPIAMEAHVDVTEGASLAVINAHPPAGSITTGPLGLALGFDASERDAALDRLRARVDRLLANASPVLVVGDYNVTPAEPAYRVLSAGLRDSHVEGAQGPGWTWRPRELEALRVGLLRIDYIFTSRDLRVIDSSVDCSKPGDHCAVHAGVEMP